MVQKHQRLEKEIDNSMEWKPSEVPMRRALELARKAWGETHPNPMVGAVITEGDVIVAEGFHAKAGEPHAEVQALRALGRPPKPNAVLYVTLEPCSTHGRTPPCVDAIVASGIKTVVVGAEDPNPLHAGKGLTHLRNHGIKVFSGVLADACTDLNLIFNHWIKTQRPFVAVKVASTLDGRLVAMEGAGPYITGELARADVQNWRKLFPAIAVSVDTLLKDNPRLTARLPGNESCPIRFVLDRHFRSAGKKGLNLFQDVYRDRTIVVGLKSSAKSADLHWYEAEGIKVWCLEGTADEFLFHWLDTCAAQSIVGVYVEAGPRLASVFLNHHCADYFFAYYSPMISGNPNSPAWTEGSLPQLSMGRTQAFGQDVLFRGFLAQ
ncbi:bifunctional diaminohydroxyphosphoribosylaminopyrimidine deaminase/5-amino-6-(5-phosphoribosylamino)uracil reductase RibD [bacterium]|nr:bifunctional diaminohydroxyphosphoribosylaminopyrimidine deaminase/5-amino-6-(5-phosphoribosylamino)uracil reductase RibD [bacterium]